MRRQASLLLLLFGLVMLTGGCAKQGQEPPALISPPINFQAVRFAPEAKPDVSEGKAAGGQTLLRLHEPDDPQHPTAWQGPLEIRRSASESCNAKVSLVTAVYTSPGLDYLIVTSYSGSTTRVEFIDAQTCGALWAPLGLYSAKVTIAKDQIDVQPGCECSGGGQPCPCDPAKHYRLNAAAAPVLQ